MFFRIFFLVLILGWFSINCLVPVPPIYRKAELALKRYVSYSSYNPIIHSLFNVLIHDKQAKAFISDQAIEMALEHMKEFDKKTKTDTEKLLRQVIYGTNCTQNENNCSSSNQHKMNQPTPDLKQRIIVALDKFFANTKTDDYWTISSFNTENKA